MANRIFSCISKLNHSSSSQPPTRGPVQSSNSPRMLAHTSSIQPTRDQKRRRRKRAGARCSPTDRHCPLSSPTISRRLGCRAADAVDKSTAATALAGAPSRAGARCSASCSSQQAGILLQNMRTGEDMLSALLFVLIPAQNRTEKANCPSLFLLFCHCKLCTGIG